MPYSLPRTMLSMTSPHHKKIPTPHFTLTKNGYQRGAKIAS